MKVRKDMTKRQFRTALNRRGFGSFEFFGYVRCPSGVHVCRFNAGDNRREQLAYLIKQNAKWEAKN